MKGKYHQKNFSGVFACKSPLYSPVYPLVPSASSTGKHEATTLFDLSLTQTLFVFNSIYQDL